MWKLERATQLDENDNGELELIRLDENGKPTIERMVLPITLADGFEWSAFPSTMHDDEVLNLLYELIDTFDPCSKTYTPPCSKMEEEEPNGFILYCKSPNQKPQVMGVFQ